jgi:hypothetical protein
MKKNKEDIYTGILFGLVLYTLGAIDFTNPVSYIVIFAVAINIGFPVFNMIKRLINKKA